MKRKAERDKTEFGHIFRVFKKLFVIFDTAFCSIALDVWDENNMEDLNTE